MLLPKRKKENEQLTVAFSEIVAAALLKFRELDLLDISILLDEFTKTKNVNIEYIGSYGELNHCQRFLEENKGGMRLKENVSLDDPFSKEENSLMKRQFEITKATTVKEALTLLTNTFVMDFVNKIDKEEFKKKKEQITQEQTKNIIENGNILLISDQEEEYEALREYGFKNIDWFKSYVRADRYFLNFIDELDKYHIIIQGNQRMFSSPWGNCLWLNKYIKALNEKKEVIVSDISVYKELQKVSVYTMDLKTSNYHRIENTDLKSTIDCLVMIAIASEIMNKKMPKKKYPPIGIYENVNKKQNVLPKKKENLKILFLDTIRVSDDSLDIARKLGLNIDFLEDNNFTFHSRVYYQLGDYDIIIGSQSYSSTLAYCSLESTEQCKDRGRKLTLLLTYRNTNGWVRKNEINLSYSFGGEKRTTTVEQLTYDQLIPNYDSIPYEERYKVIERYAKTSIIEEAVSLYNEKLVEINQEGILDLDFKRASEHQKEYDQKQEEERRKKAEERARREEELRPIRQYNYIEEQVRTYLDHLAHHRIDEEPNDLEFEEVNDGLSIKSYVGDRKVCEFIISNHYHTDRKNIKIFALATLSNKGNLSKPEFLSYHTSEYDNYDLPPRPNELQQKAIDGIEKKIMHVLVPLNEKAEKNNRKIKQNIKRRNNKPTFN